MVLSSIILDPHSPHASLHHFSLLRKPRRVVVRRFQEGLLIEFNCWQNLSPPNLSPKILSEYCLLYSSSIAINSSMLCAFLFFFQIQFSLFCLSVVFLLKWCCLFMVCKSVCRWVWLWKSEVGLNRVSSVGVYYFLCMRLDFVLLV